MRLPASGLGGLRQHSRTRHFSLNFKPLERRNPFQHLPQRGSSYPLFAGTGEPAKRSFLRRTLLQAKAESSVCSQSHDENETTCSDSMRRASTQEIHRDRKPPRPTAAVQQQVVVFNACSNRFHGLVFCQTFRTWSSGSNKR